jgi:NADH-quinone oxidoreductase subunit E
MASHDYIEYPQVQEDPNTYAFTAEELAEIERHVAKYPTRQSAVMPALWIAQNKWGWLPHKAMQLVADTLGLEFAQVYGVATFYTMYLKERKGKHLLEICTCFTCGECGGAELYRQAQELLQVDEEGVSQDGLFYLREAECLGACDTNPVMQVNNKRYAHHLTLEKFSHIVAELKAGRELPYEQIPLIDQSKIG